MNMEQYFIEQIANRLNRSSIKTPSRWAEEYRVMGGTIPGKWSFDKHPWTRAMHDSEAEKNVGQKAAQMGFTETLLNITFFKIDVQGIDCLYLLPSKTPDASDFSASRFDPALELSPHLMNMFSDVKNVGHKRAGTTNLYIRGTQSRAGLKSIPAGFVALDELEEMVQDNVALAYERAAGQLHKQFWLISTPTVEGHGINKEFGYTTQEHYMFKCPSCSRMTELVFPECLMIMGDDPTDERIKESYLICKECKATLPHLAKPEFLAKGEWVASKEGRVDRGFWVPQLNSYTVKPYELATSYLRSQTDPALEQEFYNSKLGLPHVVAGAKIDDDQISMCIRGHTNSDAPPTSSIVTIGIDVGTYLHYEVDQWIVPNLLKTQDMNLECKCRVVRFGKVKDFQEIYDIIRRYSPMSVVIDANPDRRKAQELAMNFYGTVRLCFYGQSEQSRRLSIYDDPNEPSVTVNRTSWLDQSLGRFKNRTIMLPADIDQEYRTHIKSMIRVPKKGRNGESLSQYVTPQNEDHYAHARTYAEIALVFALDKLSNSNISGRQI